MIDIYNARYILLDEKKPKHAFKDYKLYENVMNESDLGILIDEPFMVLDFDDEGSFNTALSLVKKFNINTWVMKTTRGGHFWFKSKKIYKNTVGIMTAVGLSCDVRHWKNQGYVKIKSKGEWREWLYDSGKLDELPLIFTPIHRFNNMNGEPTSLLGYSNGDGRNDFLYNFIIKLVNKGFTRDEVRDCYKIINEYIFKTPLDDSELETILREDSFKNVEKQVEKMTHNVMAYKLMEELNIIKNNGRLFFFNGKQYLNKEDFLYRKIIEKNKTSKDSYRREVRKYIEAMLEETDPYIDDNFILCNNGVIDIKNNRLLDFDDKIFFRNCIDTNFEPNCYDEDVDILIDRLCSHDKTTRLLLEEMIGYALTQTTKYQKFFVIVGSGRNGKSTFFKLLSNMIGNENISNLSIEDFETTFRPSVLLDKMLNLGDDIDGAYIRKTELLKKATTGDALLIEKKGQDPFSYNPYAKLIFSCNAVPLFADKSYGMQRRMCIIPFENEFSKENGNYNVNILDIISTEKAKSYLLNLGLQGLRRLFEQGEFTESEISKERTELYEEDNNNIIRYLYENEINLNLGLSDMYSKYKAWCDWEEVKPFSRSVFRETVSRKLNVTYKLVSIGGVKTRRFVEK